MEQGPMQRGPQTKLPTNEGQEDIHILFVPDFMIALRVRHVCSLPRALTDIYKSLRESSTKRFKGKDPASTICRKLADISQKGESNDEFGEEVRRLVTQAYPGTDLEMQDQLAAEAFLKGYQNSRIEYDALNRAPRTLNDARVSY